MKAPVSASLGAMGSLLEKLDLVLDPEDDLGRTRRLPKGVKNGMHILKEDLEEIGTYLHDLLEVDDPPLTAKSWMKEVRELSYDIEDYIDRFAQPGHSATSKARSIFKISRVEKMKKRRKGMISEFGIRAQGAIERHERYELGCRDLRRRFAPIGPMLPTPYEEGADLVIDGRTSEFIEKLANDGDEQLKVVSVVGSGGIGKTTLARVLYNKLRGQFDCRAFVKMNQNPDIKIVVHDMLTQLQRNDQAHDDCHDLYHISKIREYLQDKRYYALFSQINTMYYCPCISTIMIGCALLNIGS